MRIQYENENGEVNPIPVGADVGVDVPELDTLSNILQAFHDVFGDIEWTDEDKVKSRLLSCRISSGKTKPIRTLCSIPMPRTQEQEVTGLQIRLSLQP